MSPVSEKPRYRRRDLDTSISFVHIFGDVPGFEGVKPSLTGDGIKHTALESFPKTWNGSTTCCSVYTVAKCPMDASDTKIYVPCYTSHPLRLLRCP